MTATQNHNANPLLLLQGGPGRSVHTGILAFMNHGCDPTFNVDPLQAFNEKNVDENTLPDKAHFEWEKIAHSPFIDRNARMLMHSLGYANRVIPAGAEIQDNFLNYASTFEQWRRAVLDLRAQCTTDEECTMPMQEAET